ncbi:hypothetical protein FSP39_009568 [Pinctada imbricata]|uniref:Uncharacterized protein n=1 Tax=Pinctada imbricata TaxID=66713 RepID=A0AA89BP62_PINIB|nr:hypothetical protein FSP39_009568 [Pinctada imbricata]
MSTETTQRSERGMKITNKEMLIEKEGEAKMAPSEAKETDSAENNNSLQWKTERKGILHCTCSCHEKPKSKTENKVTFCDIPREIVSENEVDPEPRQPSPSIIITEEIILAEPPPGHWPLKRSASLESRDNPFQPDGNLSKEADDLLARAIIIRDQFIINDQGNVVASNSSSPNHSAKSSPVKSNTEDGKPVVEETMSATLASESHAAPDKPKQNGKLDDSSVSPESVRPEVNSDGSTNPEEKLRDKKKQQKCCIIM